MLCLTRKEGEQIRIGDATVTVLRHSGNKVRLGISAPPNVPIVRGELLLKYSPITQCPQCGSTDFGAVDHDPGNRIVACNRCDHYFEPNRN